MGEESDDQEMSILDFYNVVQVDDVMLEQIVQNSPHDVKKIYTTIKNTIIPKLTEFGWNTDIVALPLSSNDYYFSRYCDDYLTEKYSYSWLCEQDSIYFIFYLDKEGKSINIHQRVKVVFTVMDVDTKIKMIKLFSNHLKEYYEWNGSNMHSMFIHYESQSNIEDVNLNKLRSDDKFPYLSIRIDVNINLLEIKDIELIDKIQDIIDEYGYKFLFEYSIHDLEFSVFNIDTDNISELCNCIVNIVAYDKIVDKYHLSSIFRDGTETNLI